MTQPLLALLAVWILLAAVGLAVWPLFARARGDVDRREIELRELEAEKARLMDDLHEVDLDRETGKLSEEDYRANQARLKARAVEVMREIEALRGGDERTDGDDAPSPSPEGPDEEEAPRPRMAGSR